MRDKDLLAEFRRDELELLDQLEAEYYGGTLPARERVLRLIKETGPISAEALYMVTGTDLWKIHSIIRGLERDGEIVEAPEKALTTVQRHARTWMHNSALQ